MTRNIVLLVSTAAVLVILFVGYSQVVRTPETSQAASRSLVAELPEQADTASEETLRIGQAEIPGGQRASYTKYNEHGRPVA